MMMRRFVNLVTENYKSSMYSLSMYSLHRLDVSKHLFYPSSVEADAAAASEKNGAAMIPGLERLPPPCTSFQPSPTTLSHRSDLPLFALVSPRSSDGRIVCCNNTGHSFLYDADSNSNLVMPTMQGYTGVNPTAIVSTGPPGAPEEDLFVLYRSGFHVLRFGPEDRESFYGGRPAWHWESLPRPPIDGAVIRSHTVIDGGRTICVSSAPDGFGTCCFDTVAREWWHAGYWELPFLGGVEYDPDLDIWLGFTPMEPHHLCVTSDLSAMEQLIAQEQPPAVEHVLQDLDAPKNWLALQSKLINLGGGRFCVAKFFQEVVIDSTSGEESEELDLVDYYHDHLDSLGSEFVVLTGVELVTTGIGSSGGVGNNKVEGLRIHKSLRYIFTQDVIKWVL